MQIKASKVYAPASNDASVSILRADSTGLARVPVVSGVVASGGDTTVMPTILGRTFYVSPTGNDSNNGTSPSTPWQSIAKVIATPLTATDGVLFQRGGTFYLPNTGYPRIDITPTPNGTNRLLFGAYGTGQKPIITNTKILNNPAGWVLNSTNVWRIQLTNPATHSGWTSAFTENSCNIGHLSVDGVTYARKMTSVAALVNNWDFYSDNANYLYVRATANPTTLASNILAAPDARTFWMASNTEYCGLEVSHTGGHAWVARGGINNVKITFCRAKEIGGSFLIGFGNNDVRYGNGMEISAGSSNWTVEDNEINNCYDAGFSFQGDNANFTNVFLRRNAFNLCSFQLELYATGATAYTNVVIENNTFTDGGFGAYAAARPTPSGQNQRCPIMSAANTSTGSKNVVLQNNTFTRAFTAYRFHVNPFAVPTWLHSQNNTIQMTSGTLMMFGMTDTINNAAAWASANGTETGSTFTVL